MITKTFYSSGIFNMNNEYSELKSTFTLVKQFNCSTKDDLDLMIDKLERLKNENFNRVHIPDFEFNVDGNNITYNTTFIKGWGIGTLIPKFAKIISEDIVWRDSDWTFDDYGMSNFIVEYKTDKIYAVDFQSYNYIPDRNYRETRWNKFRNFQSKIFKDMFNGEWINPACHPMR